ncbi:hypothetical protein LY78DRAFT_373470 [Colletotrichum sublineola]|nr:hypothetical protein LY78DRAFT_373470 [Colletotrichum sublineola]
MVPILPQDYAFAGSPPGTGESSLFEFGRRSLSAAPDLTAQDSLVDAAMRLVDGRDRNPVPPAEKARDRWVLVGEVSRQGIHAGSYSSYTNALPRHTNPL